MPDETVASTPQEAGIPDLVADIYYGPVREAERKYVLGEVAWRRAERIQSLGDIRFRGMTTEEQDIFTEMGTERIECYPVKDRWYKEKFLIGDYAMRVSGKDGKPLGHLSFGLISNGDAVIMQVHGVKGENFNQKQRNVLVQKALEFFGTIETRRVFLITGKIINNMRKTPDPLFENVYKGIAQDNGFINDLFGLPFIDMVTDRDSSQ